MDGSNLHPTIISQLVGWWRQLVKIKNPPHRKFNKIFCIGYNKTGTTSMEAILRALGYQCPDQGEQTTVIVKALYQGDFQPMIEFCNRYDAFQDMPFSQGPVYAQVDCLFPNSKFILTVRDSSKWFESLVRFQLQCVLKPHGIEKLENINESTFKDKNIYLYKNYTYESAKRKIGKIVNNRLEHDWSLLYNREHRIKLYEERNSEIIQYFQNRPESLLVIDLEKECDISSILSFLELPETLNMPIPHLNRSA